MNGSITVRVSQRPNHLRPDGQEHYQFSRPDLDGGSEFCRADDRSDPARTQLSLE